MKIKKNISVQLRKYPKWIFSLSVVLIVMMLLMSGVSIKGIAASNNIQKHLGKAALVPNGIIDESDTKVVENSVQPSVPESPDISFIYVDQTYMEINGDGSSSQPYMELLDAAYDVDAGGTLEIRPGHYPAEELWNKATLLTAPSGSVILEAFPTLTGAICGWGEPDCNMCVNNITSTFQTLPNQGNELIYQLDSHPEPQYNGSWYIDLVPPYLVDEPDFYGHWQGVQRLSGGDGRYLLVTRDEITHPTQGFHYSGFAIVHMGSRNIGGYKWSSNLSDPDNDLDTIIQTAYIDYNDTHPGGVQILGDFLAVGTGSKLGFFDVSDPGNISEFPTEISILPDRSPYSGSSTSLAKLQNGRYLLVVSSSNACPLDIYISDQPNTLLGSTPSVSFSKFDRWYTASGGTADSYSCNVYNGEYHGDTYQSINLVTDCETGDLYLIATGNRDSTATCGWQDWPFEFDWPCAPNGQDWADLYLLNNAGNHDVSLTWVDDAVFSTTHGNFDAAAGIYVNPNGQLYLYTTEHSNLGPVGGSPPNNSIEFMEFGP